MTGYTLGKASLKELEGVEPKLVSVVKRAIELTKQDFSVHDGVRTIEQQREYVRRGVSKTMKSRHLEQENGLGRAVDLVPFINGKLRWEWGPIYEIAAAMSNAAREKNVVLIWGGAWDRPMTEYPSSNALQCRMEVERYKVRHAGTDFIDGPHFELVL